VDISDALSEQEKVKFTVHTKVSEVIDVCAWHGTVLDVEDLCCVRGIEILVM